PILAGLLADYVTEPAMQSQTWVARAFGWMVGNESGSGMALQFVITGIAYVLVALIVYLFFPHVRNLEDELPDHDQLQKVDELSVTPAPITIDQTQEESDAV
ncbi:MAG TPA: hypothetical protein VKE92_07230, partial [Anaerolineales bacterium]|nr:hypothetical protein [Anaerolineales bacterium]